jgi:hypothetical protein
VTKEIVGPVGAVALGLLWIFWRLRWNIRDLGPRWDGLPLWERLGAVVIVIVWTVLVEWAAWQGTSD